MAYCHNCGEKLPKDAYFCSKCGTKTPLGTETNAPAPSEEMRQEFAKMSLEIEKAFTVASKEIRAAFQTARENVQKSMEKESVVCGKCSEINPGGSVYCYKCGQKIEVNDQKKNS
jgi:ribosomal protein L40E